MQRENIDFSKIICSRNLSKWDGKEKGKAMNKTYRDANLAGKHSGHHEKKQTSGVTPVDGLSRNCRQTHTLQLIRIQIRRLLNIRGGGQWNEVKEYARQGDQVRIKRQETERGIRRPGYM